MAKKIMFVVDTLAQHGAERYLYELVKALVDNNYSVAIYSTFTLQGVTNYYADSLQKLGVTIIFPSAVPYPNIKNKLFKRIANSFAYRVRRRFSADFLPNKLKNNLIEFLNSFDAVSIIKWEAYVREEAIFDQIINKKIHVMSALAQYADYPYTSLPKGKTEFITMYPEQKEEILAGRINDGSYSFATIPLLLDNESWTNYYLPGDDGTLRIGIFSRITYDQPTIFALAIIHELKSKGVPVILYFFGRYYDEFFYKHYLKTAEILKIAVDVKFMGHTGDIAASIKDNRLDLGIMNAWDSFIGYSSIEIQSYGLPVIFFNVVNSGYSSDTFPLVYNTVAEVSNKIESLWANPGQLKELSNKTFSYAKQQYGVKANIGKILSIYSADTKREDS